jgi:hypothetical protein
MRTQILSYNVAVCGVVIKTFNAGSAGLAAAERCAQDVAATLVPTLEQDGQAFEQVVTVDQIVDGIYFGEASRFPGCRTNP